MADIYLAKAGGDRVPFMEIFAGFEPQSGFATTPLPFPKADVAAIVYASGAAAAAEYDGNANNNGFLEEPELLVLYIRESALGLGHSVDHIGVNPRIDALATAKADTGGLMEFVKKNKSKMSKEAQAIFADLERLGLDWRSRGKGGGASGR